MIKTIIMSIAVMASTTVLAQKIYMPIPFSAGGSVGAMTPTLVEELTKKGWTVEYKMIGSCGPVKETFEKSTDSVVTVWGSSWQNKGNTCRIEYTPDNFVDILQQNSLYFCGQKNNLDFKLEAGKTYTVGINTFNSPNEIKSLEAVASKAGVKFKFIVYKNSGAIRTAYEAKEIDTFYGSIGLAESSKGLVKCLFTNADESIGGIPNIKTLLPNLTHKGESFIATVITNGKGLTSAETARLKSDIRNILTQQPLNDFLTGRYLQRYSAEPSEQLKFIQDRSN